MQDFFVISCLNSTWLQKSFIARGGCHGGWGQWTWLTTPVRIYI